MLRRLILITLFTFAATINVFSQEKTNVSGEWMLEHIAKNGKYESIGALLDFNEDGKVYTRQIPMGTWEYNQAENTIIMNIKDKPESYEIVYLSSTNMQLSVNDEEWYLSKIDREKIEKDNLASGLIGLWEYANDMDDGTRRLIEFKAPDNLTLIEKSKDMQSRSSGMWLFDAELNKLTIIGQIERIRGTNEEVTITDNEVNFVNNKVATTLKKVTRDTVALERLTFKKEDFYDENGDYKYYDDEQKLPWNDSMEMMMKLENVKQLVYTYSTLIEGAVVFEKKTLIANVDSNLDEETLSIDFIFYGYDRYNLPEDAELPPNEYDEYNDLYPLEDHTYRVVGEENITTPAGSFNCTVVEAAGSFDENIKLWMINDQPGIVAKIIKDEPGKFGHYIIYELQEIK